MCCCFDAAFTLFPLNSLHILKAFAGFRLFLSVVSCTELLSYGGLGDSAACWFQRAPSHALQFDALYEKKKKTQTGIWVQLVNKKYCITPLISGNCCLCVDFHRFSPSEVIPFIFPVCKDFFQIGYTLNFHVVVLGGPTSSGFSLCSPLLCIIACTVSFWAALHLFCDFF